MNTDDTTRRQAIDNAKARMDRAFVNQADCEAKTIDAEANLHQRKQKQTAAEREVDDARQAYFDTVNAPEPTKTAPPAPSTAADHGRTDDTLPDPDKAGPFARDPEGDANSRDPNRPVERGSSALLG